MGRRTSTDTFHERERTGAAKSDKRRVLRLLHQYSAAGVTGFEVDAILHDLGLRGHFHKRLSELGAAGLAHRSGTRKSPVTGRKGDLWFPGPAPEPTVAELEARICEVLKEAIALDVRAVDLRLKADRYQREIDARVEEQREMFG